jgi:8-oxo-dGTP diphosphatase
MNYIDAVTFIPIHPDGKILMQLRDDGGEKTIPYPNMWCFPGGGKEEKETHIEAVIREMKEEFNLDVGRDDCHLIMEYDHDDNRGDQIFICRIPQDAMPELHEGAEMKWMTLEEIERVPLAWQQHTILSELKEKIKKFLRIQAKF